MPRRPGPAEAEYRQRTARAGSRSGHPEGVSVSTVSAPSRRNGVDTARLFATLDAVKAQPEAAQFKFSVHNRCQISTFFGVGAEQQREGTFAIEADHPAVLVGEDTAPTPAEILLAA